MTRAEYEEVYANALQGRHTIKGQFEYFVRDNDPDMTIMIKVVGEENPKRVWTYASPMSFADFMQKRGYTTTKLAEDSGLGYIQISYYVSGRRNVRALSSKLAYRLCNTLDCTLGYMLSLQYERGTVSAPIRRYRHYLCRHIHKRDKVMGNAKQSLKDGEMTEQEFQELVNLRLLLDDPEQRFIHPHIAD